MTYLKNYYKNNKRRGEKILKVKMSMNIRNSGYFICLFGWLIIYSLSVESTLDASISLPIGRIYTACWIIIRAVLFLRIIKLYKGKDLILALLIIVIGLLTTYYSHTSFMDSFFWFLAASKGVSVREQIKIIFKAQCVTLICIVLLASMGIIENIIMFRENNNLVRYALGFNHPNMIAGKIFQLCLISFCLYGSKMKMYFCLVYAGIATLTIYITDSETVKYMFLLLLVLLVVYLGTNSRVALFAYVAKRSMKLLKAFMITALALCVFIIATFQKYNYYSIFGGTTLYSRVKQMFLYFSTYDIKLWGQELYYHGAEASNSAGLYTLDNSYLYLLLGFGIVAFSIFVFLYLIAIRRAYKEKNYIAIIVLAIYAIYGLSETMVLRFSSNFTLVFLFYYGFWYKGNNKIE